MSGGPSSADRVQTLREVLTATGAGIYLATHVAGPIPAETLKAVRESDDMELRLGRVGPERAGDLEQRDKEARAVVAAVIGAQPDRILLSHGAADAAGALAQLVLRASGTEPAQVLAIGAADGSLSQAVRLAADAAGAEFSLLAEAPQIMAADVALVVLAHIRPDGTALDVPRTVETAHKAGARVLVDASLSVGALPVDVAALGADALVADTHHWLLGPDAMAFLWLAPVLGADAPSRLRQARAPFGRGALLALARSVGWLLMYVEMPWVIARTENLAGRLCEALAAIEGVELATDISAHGALLGFRIRGWDVEQAADELSRSIFAILEAHADSGLIRASVGAWNREEELDRLAERVAELASHTPETLPRRPTLTVISGPLDDVDEP